MSEARVADAPRRPWRSAGAVLAGLASIVILATAVDTVLEQIGVFPSIAEQRRNGFDVGWMLALALTYRFAFAIIGGYVTAALAPSRPTRHVTVLMIIGFVLGWCRRGHRRLTGLVRDRRGRRQRRGHLDRGPPQGRQVARLGDRHGSTSPPPRRTRRHRIRRRRPCRSFGIVHSRAPGFPLQGWARTAEQMPGSMTSTCPVGMIGLPTDDRVNG
jgi:hypothetical protein